MQIGSLKLKNNLFLAPMAGVCDHSFRMLCLGCGAGLVYSEMISAKALSFNDEKTKRLARHEGESPFAVQIFGHEPKVMAEAAVYMEQVVGADLIDINMGCPAPKIVNNGDGSALMKTPELCGEIVNSVKNAVSLPVTAKIRSGFDAVNAVEIAKIVEAAGADAVTVHGRTRVQQYSGRADRSVIKAVKDNLKIPVIANGDVDSRESYDDMLLSTGADAVMIGRGAMGNPWIFSQILNGSLPPSPEEKIRAALYHTKLLLEDKGEHIGILESRKHVCWYLKGIRGGGAVRQQIFAANSYEDMERALENL